MLILLSGCLTVKGEEILKYELTPEKIERAWISDVQPDAYPVIVQLNKQYRKDFSQLTGTNIGKRLAIIFSGETLISPVIKGEIKSGIIIINKWNSEEDARKFIKTLLPEND